MAKNEEHENAVRIINEKTTEREEYLAKTLISRLNRIEGQVRGIKGMIERDSYCDDVLNQITAVRAALRAVGELVLENHIKSCIVERIHEGDSEILDELLITIGKML